MGKRYELVSALPHKGEFSVRKFYKLAKEKGFTKKEAKEFFVSMRERGYIIGCRKGWLMMVY